MSPSSSVSSFPVDGHIFNIGLWWIPFTSHPELFSLTNQDIRSLKVPSWQRYTHPLSLSQITAWFLLSLWISQQSPTGNWCHFSWQKKSWCTSALGTWDLCLSHWWECDWSSVNWRGHLQKENCTWKASTLHIVTGLESLRSPETFWSFRLSWLVWWSLHKWWLGKQIGLVRSTFQK